MPPSDVLVFGESLIDLIEVKTSSGDPLPSFRAHPGGSPFNAAIALARQGVRTGFATPISTDQFGDLLLESLSQAGAHYAYPHRLSLATSLALVHLKQGQPAYQFYRTQVADRASDFDQLRKLPLPKWVQIGGLALAPKSDSQAWLKHIDWMTKQGVRLSFDPNVRKTFIEDQGHYREICDALARQAHIVKLSDEDAAYIYPDKNPVDHLLKQGVTYVALTKGTQGADLATSSDRISIPAPRLSAQGDSVGAGDTFGAALLARVLDGITDLEALGTYAATAAALNCEQMGCTPPTKADILARLDKPALF